MRSRTRIYRSIYNRLNCILSQNIVLRIYFLIKDHYEKFYKLFQERKIDKRSSRIETRRMVPSISSLEARRPLLPLKREEDISIMSGSLSKGEI
jgi:hypothetical protein